MTNLLTKAFQSRLGGQSDEVVSDGQNRPVCLDALPGSHKHFPEAEVLLDVLVKDLDQKALRINLHHLRLGHLNVVGDKETIMVSCAGNKKFDRSNLRQPDHTGSDSEMLFFENPDSFVKHPSLGQERHGDFDAIQEHVAVLFQSSYEDSARLLNRIENGGAGIPCVHNNSQSSGEKEKSFLENFQSQSDFAFERTRSASFFGTVSSEGKDQTQGTRFQKASHRTQSFCQALGGMVKSKPLDLFSISWSQGVVENQKRVFGILDLRLTKCRDQLRKLQNNLRRFLNEVMQTVGIAGCEVSGDFPDRSELDQIQESRQINQKVNALRFAQNLQERFQIGRNYFRAMFAHGLRVLRLRGLVSIGDFDRKPFYLKGLS